jgi:hypothetical protein
MLRTATNAMPASPSPKDVISITAGRRPAAKEQHILLLPERQDSFRIDNAGAGQTVTLYPAITRN